MRNLPSISPPTRHSLADDVVARLRDAILHGSFGPGQHLREEELASMLDVSRGTLRGALTILEREGLVVVRRNRGATVAQLSRTDVEEVYILRLAIERLAVQLAVRNGQEREFDAMQRLLDSLRDAVASGITEQVAADFDTNFHDLIYQAAHHRRLYDAWTSLKSQIYLFLLTRNIANPDFREFAVNTHAAILDALRDREEKRAVQLIEIHLTQSYERIIPNFEDSAGEKHGDGNFSVMLTQIPESMPESQE